MNTRFEKDSLGTIAVPETAFWGAQTQRAVENFSISNFKMPTKFIGGLALLKQSAAKANLSLGLLSEEKFRAIKQAVTLICDGGHFHHFPVDVFQTGSGTSSNMNMNEVISFICKNNGVPVHPNDDVNKSQSSNDMIPSAIAVSAVLLINQKLLPSIDRLINSVKTRMNDLNHVVKTGRTHLMDAMPVTFAQEMSGWMSQLNFAKDRVRHATELCTYLAVGGTAVGTGINAPKEFAALTVEELSNITKQEFHVATNFFELMASQDRIASLSGQLKVLASTLLKISNDLRWMNSGPLGGLAEISLPSLQPGSSIMPGKVNPVIPEAVAMVATHVIGTDQVITMASSQGNFQLNVMLPLIAFHLLENITSLSNACEQLAQKAIDGFIVNQKNIDEKMKRNPILVTALNPIIGYDLGAQIAKEAYATNRSLIDVALERTSLTREQLEKILNPLKLTEGGSEQI